VQRAALVVRVARAVIVGAAAMVNVVVMGVAHRSAIAGIGGGVLLARDRMLEMDGDQRDDAGQLGDQKQPQQPAAEPTSRVPRNHGNPTPPAVISALGPRDGGAKDTARENSGPDALPCLDGDVMVAVGVADEHLAGRDVEIGAVQRQGTAFHRGVSGGEGGCRTYSCTVP
jgi:hypothetical protein